MSIPTSPQKHGLALTLHAVNRRFGDQTVLDQLDLQIGTGEFIAIVGRSGCGKSTLLRLLAGLDHHDGGSITAEQAPLAGQRDAIRLMFQDARLLPWKSVLDNVGLGLKGDWKAKARQALAEVGLADKTSAWPSQLSGGQRQRAALARALIHEPQVLLLDEPLGALDALTRIEMQKLIERIWFKHRFTTVLVTHDVQEAITLADRVVMLDHGRVAHDWQINLPRPRPLGSAELAFLEAQVLGAVMANTQAETHSHQLLQSYPGESLPLDFSRLRWAL